MTQDEVRMLDNRYALLFIRGERPIMDLKYDILKSQPFAAVLRAGTVNAGAAKNATGADITDTIKAGLPRIDFIY